MENSVGINFLDNQLSSVTSTGKYAIQGEKYSGAKSNLLPNPMDHYCGIPKTNSVLMVVIFTIGFNKIFATKDFFLKSKCHPSSRCVVRQMHN